MTRAELQCICPNPQMYLSRLKKCICLNYKKYFFELARATLHDTGRAGRGSFHLVCSNGQTIANYFKLVQSDPKYFKGHCIAAASEGQALGSFQITLEGTHSQYNYINAVHRLH